MDCCPVDFALIFARYRVLQEGLVLFVLPVIESQIENSGARRRALRGVKISPSPSYKEKVPQGPPAQKDPPTFCIAIADMITYEQNTNKTLTV
jgi:hypothetical protein